MKRTLVVAAIAVAVLFASQALAGPIAKVPPLNDSGKKFVKQAGKKAEDMLKDVPDESLVGLPAYPDSYFVSAVHSSSSNMLSAVNLVTADSVGKVHAWYRTKLKGWYYDKTMGCFYNSDKKLPLPKLFGTPAVIIQESSPESLDLIYWDVPKIKTRIQLTFREK